MTDIVTRNLELQLKRTFKALLKPVKVKSLVITKTEGNTVRGYLLTVCPIEKRESGRDFEVGLAGNHGRPIRYALVDGKRLSLKVAESPRRNITKN